MRSRSTELLERRQVRPEETLQIYKTSPSQHPKKKACYRMEDRKMTDTNWNGNVEGPWGRFGEPEQSYSAVKESMRQPRRKLSWDGDEELDLIPSIEPMKTDEDEIPSAPIRVLSPTTRRGRRLRQQQHQHIEDDYFFKEIIPQQDYLQVPPAFRKSQLERPMSIRKSQRRASTGESPFLESPTKTTRSFLTRFCEDEKPRRISLGATRPCMETTFGSLSANLDGPITRRRTWLGSTRPCMENTLFNRGAGLDGPILRPYRQLSSEDLCIGEETDEDLSNRSMLRTADLSIRSNRSIDVSSRSNRSLFRTIDNADLSSHSNRSIFDLSNRSNRSVFNIDALGSNRSNRSCFRTPTEDELNNHSLIRSTDMNASSRSIRSYNGDNMSNRSMHRTGDITSHSNRTCFRSTAVSPLHEEEHTATIEDEELEESIREISLHDSDHPSVTRTPTTPTTPPTSSPGPWPVKSKSVDNGKNDEESCPPVVKSKTWPTNLMILLSIRRLALRNLSLSDCYDEDKNRFPKNVNRESNERRSLSPNRKNILSRTI